MAKKTNSPYSASFTGCTFMFAEFNSVLPIMMDGDVDANIKKETIERTHLQVNKEVAASRVLSEFKKRFKAMPPAFWDWYVTLSEKGQKAALFYVLLKTYRLLFEFHTNVTIKKWNSIERTLSSSDILGEYYAIAARDEFVDSWSDQTRSKLIGSYLTILKQAGLLDADKYTLRQLKLDAPEYSWYLQNGDSWFLEACLLYSYEIDEIKQYSL